MGLQVWLPLNGNLNNQGLSNVTVTNNGATVDDNGKIGKCYSFNGNSNYISLTNINCNAWAQCTVAFWCYPTNSFDYIYLVRGSGAHRFRINSGGLAFRDTNHSSTVIVPFNTTIETNVWSHITCVYNRGEVYMYVNGVLTNHSTSYYNANSVLLSDLSEYRIARQQSTSADNYYTGRINDFRIYDNALTASEVKSISQGLILHYPLDRNGWGQDNLAHNTYGLSPFSTSQVEFKAYDVGVLDVTNGETITISFFLDMTVATAANSGYLLAYNTNYKGPHQIASVNVLEGRKLVVGEDIHERISFTTTINNRSDANRSTDVLEFYSNYNTENEIFISNIKVERGTKATQWSPNPSDTLYATMGIGNAVEYDISGYQNNGTRTGNYTWSSNSHKYNVSTYFEDYTRYISCLINNDMIPDSITMSCWIKSTNTSPKGGYHIPLNMHGTNFEISIPSNGKARMGYVVGGTRYVSDVGSGLLDGNWHMMTSTFNGSTICRYIDGVLINSENRTGALTALQTLGVGNFPAGTTYGNTQVYESDVRIYVTALSADDILELYNNKVI